MAARLIGRTVVLGVSFAVLAIFPAAATRNVIVISTAPTVGISCQIYDTPLCTQDAVTATFNVQQLETMLASSSVTIDANTEIDVDAEITWASNNTLELIAPMTVVIDRPIIVTGAGGLGIAFAPNGALLPTFGQSGRIAFWNTSSYFGIGAGPFQATTRYQLVNNIQSFVSYLKTYNAGSVALADNYDARADGVYTSSPIPYFEANFIGLNNTISNLSIVDNTKGHYVGLFGDFDEPGSSISWLKLRNVHVHGGDASQVGAIAGHNVGTVWGVSSQGAVSTAKSVGSSSAIAGGLVGWNYGVVQNSSVSGNVTGGENAIVGGAVGEDVPVKLPDGQYMIGQIMATYSSAAVSLNSGTCTGCKIGTPNNSAGGLVGVNNGVVESCYATGPVTGGSLANLGGLLGLSMGTPYSATGVSYSTGAVSGGSGSSIGGAIGFDQQSEEILYVDWDMTTSGIDNSSQGAGNIANDPEVSGLTTAQLQSGLPPEFKNFGWAENAKINSGLPYLISNPPN